MKGCLLDVNLLIALAWPNHPHHGLAHAWFKRHHAAGWGTCLVTQLGFIRVSSHPSLPHSVSTREAIDKMREIVGLPTHVFWPEPPKGFFDPAFSQTASRILTHGQVTDAYLATVAASHGGKLATLDRQLARTFDSISVLVGNQAR